jgi:NAD(P)-dependent dehydrogenase (short-subunit alcohol dehydrogenase family)
MNGGTVEADARVDVVVGAGSGMGAAAAAALRSGRNLVLADRDHAALERVGATFGERVECIVCDVTEPADVARLAARIPLLGSLVVTAGLSPTMADGERIFGVNLVGMARLLDALDASVTNGSAAVCFASIAGHGIAPPDEVVAVLDDPLAPAFLERLRDAGIDPTDPNAAYGLSKLGVIRLVRRLAAGWGRRGARVLSLSPGIIDTPMGRQELEQQPMMGPMIDLVGRMGRPDELAAVAAFLVSDGASFMNGCDVLVDGGFMAATST